jgi:hypothetical protein
VAGRIRSTEKSNHLIGNRTRGLPASSTVPQRTTLKTKGGTEEYNKMDLRKFECANAEYIHLPQFGGSCEHGNEPSGSIKRSEADI